MRALVTLLVGLAACAASHDREEECAAGVSCGGECHPSLDCRSLISPGCCGTVTHAESCGSDGLVSCRPGTMPEAECERHGPVCAEPEDASIARIDECTHHTDCVIVPASCCPACGMPEIDDVRAIARGHEHEYESEVCTERSTECGSCETENNAWLVPRCSDGVCGVIDLRETEIVRCSTDGDCRLRAVTCCECAIGGDASRVVAISRDADEAVAELLCHEGQTCRSCVPGYPMDVIAHCDEGRCGTRAR